MTTAAPARQRLKVVCPHDCPDTCVMTVDVEAGRAVGLGGDPDHRFIRERDERSVERGQRLRRCCKPGGWVPSARRGLRGGAAQENLARHPAPCVDVGPVAQPSSLAKGKLAGKRCRAGTFESSDAADG
jgi:hypothetical protein